MGVIEPELQDQINQPRSNAQGSLAREGVDQAPVVDTAQETPRRGLGEASAVRLCAF